MTLQIIPDTLLEQQLRDLLNQNTGEVEERLQGIEVIEFLRSGAGAPDNSLYNEGDVYIDLAARHLYKKIEGVWADRGSMIGPQGPQGTPGVGTNNRGNWSSGETYFVNDAVTYRGSFWRALRQNSNTEPTTSNTVDWQLTARGFFYAGEWAPNTSYRESDTIRYQGSMYRSRTNHVSATDSPPAPGSTNYSLAASKGDIGQTGPQGEVGPPGPTGPQGTPGVGVTNRGAWNSGTQYFLNDAVAYRGSTWRSKATNTNVEPTLANSATWEKSSAGFFQAGNWTAGTNYRVDDIVTYNGALYRVRTDHTSASGSVPSTDTTNYSVAVPQGPVGPVGNAGPIGPVGPIGQTGPQGPQGLKGVTLRGPWASTTTYFVEDIVTYEGQTWAARVQNVNTLPAEGATWTLFAKQGVQGVQGNTGATGAAGADGVNMIPRGTWLNTTTYNLGDGVRHNGSQWRALRTSVGVTPVEGADWTLFISKGDIGPQGVQGPPGPLSSVYDNGVYEGNNLIGLDFVGPHVSVSQDTPNSKHIVNVSFPVKTFIDGVNLVWNSAGTTMDSIGLTSGLAWIPGLGAAGKMYEVGDTVVRPTTPFVANTMYSVYLYDANGTPTLEFSTERPFVYSGSAAVKGPSTGPDYTRRYVGTVVTNASGVAWSFMISNDNYIYTENMEYTLAPWSWANGGSFPAGSIIRFGLTHATPANRLIPPSSRVALSNTQVNTNIFYIQTSTDALSNTGTVGAALTGGARVSTMQIPLNASQEFIGAGSTVYGYLRGYEERR